MISYAVVLPADDRHENMHVISLSDEAICMSLITDFTYLLISSIMVDVLVQEIKVVNCTADIVNSTEAAMQLLKQGECK